MMQVGSRGPFRDSQHLSDLSVRESFDVVQNYHRSSSLGEFPQSVPQSPMQLFSFCGITEGVCDSVRELISRPDFAPSRCIERRIRDDAIQPCAKRLVRTETIERLVRAQKSFLHCILGVLVHRNDRSRDCVRSALVKPNEPSKRRRVTALRCQDEALLVLRITHYAYLPLREASWTKNVGSSTPEECRTVVRMFSVRKLIV
jgi:hypothetical protein